ncbi:MAG: diphthine--ammonia ligase [Candidatus Omnitrophica bacterium]|nr:diphthine--ammonia ligase [Candidatus Omnitrophota bacterium]
MVMEKIIFAWSGGKDSAMALYELKKNRDYEISALLTTITEDYSRISMHGVREILLEQQADSLGLPLEKIYITKKSSNEEYETKMRDTLIRYQSNGVFSVAFGDIFLEDLKKYREGNLLKIGMKGIFPVWKRNSFELANTFIDLGFKAVITCIDSKVLDKAFAGRNFDKQFLSELPPNVDPCGENGEFHSFVYEGPIFSKRILYEKGEVVLRDNRYYFCDLMPVENKLAVGANLP